MGTEFIGSALSPASLYPIARTLQSQFDLAPTAKPQFARHDLRDIVVETIASVRQHAHDMNIKISHAIPREPTMILGDAGQLREAFTNLLLQAVDVLPDGGTINVEVSVDDPLPDSIRVDISSLGSHFATGSTQQTLEPVGTAHRVLPQLPDPAGSAPVGFHRPFANSLPPDYQRIIEEHGGIISTTNRAIGGAFIVELPR